MPSKDLEDPEDDFFSPDQVAARKRRDYIGVAAMVISGGTLLMFAMEAATRNPRFLWIVPALASVVTLVVLITSFPNMSNRIADRVRWESSEEYSWRQRIRIACYIGYAVTSAMFLTLLFGFALYGISFPGLLSGTFALNTCFLLWPPFTRPKKK